MSKGNTTNSLVFTRSLCMDKSLGWPMNIRVEVSEEHEGGIRTSGMDDTWGIGGIRIMISAHQNILFTNRDICGGT